MTPITILYEAEMELWEAVEFYENRRATVSTCGPRASRKELTCADRRDESF